MARILNLIIVILELIAFARTRKSRKLKDCMIYYTQISNMLTLVSSLLFVILGQRYYVEVFRYLSVSMLIMTFFVTAGILVPMSGGSIIRFLNNLGYESYAASVDPTGSAWDRACELYAQLTGTRTDYGAAHSKAAGHERFGRDFSKRALTDDFGSSRIALIGHSYGGATIRLFSEILKNGSEEERAFTEEPDMTMHPMTCT